MFRLLDLFLRSLPRLFYSQRELVLSIRQKSLTFRRNSFALTFLCASIFSVEEKTKSVKQGATFPREESVERSQIGINRAVPDSCE